MINEKYTRQDTYYIQVLLSTYVHSIKTKYGTRKGGKGDIKLHFQTSKMQRSISLSG